MCQLSGTSGLRARGASKKVLKNHVVWARCHLGGLARPLPEPCDLPPTGRRRESGTVAGRRKTPPTAARTGYPRPGAAAALDGKFNGYSRMQPFSSPVTKSLAQAAHKDVFDLQVIVDAVFGALAPRSGLLDAAERRHLVGDDALVDTYDAVFQCFGDPPTRPISRV